MQCRQSASDERETKRLFKQSSDVGLSDITVMALAALFLPPSHAAFLPPSSPFRSPKKLPAALFPSLLLGQRTNAVVLLRSGGGPPPPPPPPLSSDRRPTTDRPRGRALRRQGGREHLIDVPGLLVHSHRVRLGKWGGGGGEGNRPGYRGCERQLLLLWSGDVVVLRRSTVRVRSRGIGAGGGRDGRKEADGRTIDAFAGGGWSGGGGGGGGGERNAHSRRCCCCCSLWGGGDGGDSFHGTMHTALFSSHALDNT